MVPSVDPNPSGRVWFTVNPSGWKPSAERQHPGDHRLRRYHQPTRGYLQRKETIATPGGTPAQQTIPVTLPVSTSPLLNVYLRARVPQLPGRDGLARFAERPTVSSTSGQLPLTSTPARLRAAGGFRRRPPASAGRASPSRSIPPAWARAPITDGSVSGRGRGHGPLQIPVTLVVANDPVIVLASRLFHRPDQTAP